MADNDTGVILVTNHEISPELAIEVGRVGGFTAVEYGLLGENSPNNGRRASGLFEAADRLIKAGANRVLIIPVYPQWPDGRRGAALEDAISDIRDNYAEVDFILVPFAIDVQQHAQLLVQSLKNGESLPQDPCIPLDRVPAGRRAILQHLGGGNELISRLAALGLIPGSPVRVIQNFGAGPLIVAVRGTRLALGREEAHKLLVREPGHHRLPGRAGRFHPHRRGGHFGK